MPIVSIIMPIYNIGHKQRAFQTAVHSLQRQTFTDFELLIINDGSPDRVSGDIARKYAKKDGRIRVIDKENGGQESTRRLGLQQAEGEFILHMDQDDYYFPNAIELFLNRQKETNADVVIAPNGHFAFSTKLKYHMPGKASWINDRVLSNREFMEEYYISFFGVNILPVSIWNKLYKQSFLENNPTPPTINKYTEDINYNMHLLPYADKISIMSDITYLWRWGGYSSDTSTYDLDAWKFLYQNKIQLMQQWSLEEKFEKFAAIEMLNCCLSSYYSLFCKCNSREQVRENILKTLSDPTINYALETVNRLDTGNPRIVMIRNNQIELLLDYLEQKVDNTRFRRRIYGGIRDLTRLLHVGG